MDQYLRDNLDIDISHGLCPECQKKYYPEVFGQAPQLEGRAALNFQRRLWSESCLSEGLAKPRTIP